MATSKEYMDYILDQLSGVEGITHRKMMGEYILYIHGRIAAYVCDDRLLVKPVAAAKRLLPDAPMEAPYPGAKEMLLVEDTDDRVLMERLLQII
ncbi:MAG: TfoX/Sxy family protein [Clostridiales bacterium]|nr:TfoX/Sxy family protein [Clostridiales bacterium]